MTSKDAEISNSNLLDNGKHEDSATKLNQVRPQLGDVNGLSKIKFRRRKILAKDESDPSSLSKSEMDEAPVIYKDYFGNQVQRKEVEKHRMTYLQKLVIADMSSIFFAITGLAYEMYSVCTCLTIRLKDTTTKMW